MSKYTKSIPGEEPLLHDFLKDLSPDCHIQLISELNEWRIMFDGSAGELNPEQYPGSNYTNWRVTVHAYDGSKLILWIR